MNQETQFQELLDQLSTEKLAHIAANFLERDEFEEILTGLNEERKENIHDNFTHIVPKAPEPVLLTVDPFSD